MMVMLLAGRAWHDFSFDSSSRQNRLLCACAVCICVCVRAFFSFRDRSFDGFAAVIGSERVATRFSTWQHLVKRRVMLLFC